MTGFWTPAVEQIAKWFAQVWAAVWGSVPDAVKKHLLLRPVPTELAANEFMRAANERQLLPSNVSLELEGDSCLFHSFTLPEQAASEVSRAVALEMERVLPLHVSKLKTAYIVSRKIDDSDRIKIGLAVAKQKKIDRLMEAANTAGTQIHRIWCVDANTKQSFEFAISEASFKRHMVRLGAGALAIASLMLATLAPQIYLDRVIAASDQISSEITSTRQATRIISQLQTEVASKQNKTSKIYALRRGRRVTALMEILTAASPDDVVLDSLRIDRDTLYLSGFVNKPEEWAIALDDLPSLNDVVILSARRTSGSERQRFDIRAQVSWPDNTEGTS
ncbi:MAG: PilN domain-containing protein [Kordiimonadaceae bacterium]|nr:PilN domain-containing protein [Kordiimonadaceae bacterium]MBO6568583.1 PilN domain-containing protein [Kordiimonadaceae bacterium]MBO6965462.1 PilN domain-containing protein [Kordiimonadaceae bacterium]